MEKEDNSRAIQMNNIRTNMSEESRVPFEENPKIDFVSTKLCLFDKTWPCGNVDSSANNILTNMNEELRIDFVSTELCLFDKTWPCRKANNISWLPWNNTTKTDNDEKTESSIKILTSKSQKPRSEFVSTKLCLFDKTWPCGKSNYFTEHTRKMEMEDDMEQNQIGSNDFVTLAPGNEKSMEQTRKMEDNTNSEQHQMGLSIKKKILIKHKQDICLSMSKTDFDAYILRYLSEDDKKKIKLHSGVRVNMYDEESQTTHEVLMRKSLSKAEFDACILRYLSKYDQNKIRLGYGVRVNMHDDESQTMHKEVMMRKFWSLKQKYKDYYLTGTWLKDFVQRRGLQVGDMIGLSWDCSRYMLCHATAEGKTLTAEVISS